LLPHQGRLLITFHIGPVNTRLAEREARMGLLRGGLAGLGAWKLGGGCLSTIIIFLILYWLLGFVL
jgi:hypothetical protein